MAFLETPCLQVFSRWSRADCVPETKECVVALGSASGTVLGAEGHVHQKSFRGQCCPLIVETGTERNVNLLETDLSLLLSLKVTRPHIFLNLF